MHMLVQYTGQQLHRYSCVALKETVSVYGRAAVMLLRCCHC